MFSPWSADVFLHCLVFLQLTSQDKWKRSFFSFLFYCRLKWKWKMKRFLFCSAILRCWSQFWNISTHVDQNLTKLIDNSWIQRFCSSKKSNENEILTSRCSSQNSTHTKESTSLQTLYSYLEPIDNCKPTNIRHISTQEHCNHRLDLKLIRFLS